MTKAEKKHILIPRHIKLSEKEKKELLEKYNITLAELPRITKKDSGMAGLGARRGDVIKIIRKSPTSGEAVYYRVVTGG